jgi:hypothetical protein
LRVHDAEVAANDIAKPREYRRSVEILGRNTGVLGLASLPSSLPAWESRVTCIMHAGYIMLSWM